MTLWRDCLEFWMGELGIPLQASALTEQSTSMRLDWLYEEKPLSIPTEDTLIYTSLTILALFALSFMLRDRQLPIKYLLRILCGVQALSTAFFWVTPAQFPYSITAHLIDLIETGYIFLLAIPVMLAAGYYILNLNLAIKLSFSCIVIAYFVILIPHQVVLHSLILFHGSLLFMPILYMCFGTVLNVMIFVALYSWVISLVPIKAMD